MHNTKEREGHSAQHGSKAQDNMTDEQTSSGLAAIGQEEEVSVFAALGMLASLWGQKHKAALWCGALISVLALLSGIGILSFAVLRIAGTVIGSVFLGLWVLRAAGILRVVSRYAEKLYTHNVMFKALTDLRIWFFTTIANNSAGGLAFTSSGDLLSRLVSDVSALDGLYLRILLPFLSATVACLVLVGTAIYCQAYSLAVVLGVVFTFSAFFLPLFSAQKTYSISREKGVQQARLRVSVLDLIRGLREVRAFGAEEKMLKQISEQNHQLEKIQLRQIRAAAITGACAFFAIQMGVAFVLFVVLQPQKGHVSPIAAIFILFLMISVYELVIGLTRSGVQGGYIARSAQRIMSITRNGTEKSMPASGFLKDNKNKRLSSNLTVEFRNVFYAYPQRAKPVLDGLRLDIASGSRIAILGSSGVGKSTLAAMLLGIVVPQSGAVYIGGEDVQNLDRHDLRRHISWLSQNTHIFDDTIRANLLLGKEGATEEELWKALDQAAIGDMVRGLPEGLDTWLGEGGIKVSGGQARRIALARILLGNAPILLLDEPTAGLDSETEKEFLVLLNQIDAGRTLILITHKLTGVEELDTVWVMEKGRIHLAA